MASVTVYQFLVLLFSSLKALFYHLQNTNSYLTFSQLDIKLLYNPQPSSSIFSSASFSTISLTSTLPIVLQLTPSLNNEIHENKIAKNKKSKNNKKAKQLFNNVLTINKYDQKVNKSEDNHYFSNVHDFHGFLQHMNLLEVVFLKIEVSFEFY